MTPNFVSSNYGGLYTTAEYLNPLSVSGLVGSAVTPFLEYYGEEASRFNRWNDRKSVFGATSKGYNVGVRQAKLVKFFKGFNALSLALGVGSLAFQSTADMVCEMGCEK